MFKYITKKFKKKQSPAQEQQEQGVELIFNENLEADYYADSKKLRTRFEILNQSYNQLLKAERVKKDKEKLTNKVVARKRYTDRIPSKKRHKLPKVKAQPNPNLDFDINRLESYFSEAIHGMASRRLIDHQIQNDIAAIKMQMAAAERNLKIDKEILQKDIAPISELDIPKHNRPAPPRDNKKVLEDVFAELDTLLTQDKAYIIDGKASIIRSRANSKKETHLKKTIKNFRV